MIPALNREGIRFINLGSFEKAIQCFQEALRLTSEDHRIQHETSVNMGLHCIGSTKSSGEGGNQTSSSHNMPLDNACNFDEDLNQGISHLIEPIKVPSTDQHIHPQILKASLLFNIGTVHFRINQKEEAEAYFSKVLPLTSAWRSTTTGIIFQGPSELGVLYNIGFIQLQLKKYNDAVTTYSKSFHSAMSVSLESNQDMHKSLDVSYALNSLGVALTHMSLTDQQCSSQRDEHFQEAADVLHKAFLISKAGMGNIDNLQTATIINNIGRVSFLRGFLKEALVNFEEAYRIRLSILEDTHIDIASSLYHIGQVQRSLGNTFEALRHYVRCLEILSSLQLGTCHPKVSCILFTIADIHIEEEEFDLALQYYMSALSSTKEAYGECHIEVAYVLNKIGETYHRQAEISNAVVFYKQALDIEHIYYQDIGPHPAIMKTLSRIAKALQFQGNCVLAVEVYDEILKQLCEQQDSHKTALHSDILDRQQHSIEAIGENLEVLKVQKQVYEGDINNLEFSLILNHVGLGYFEMGLVSSALAGFKESLLFSLQTQEGGNRYFLSSMVLYNIASCYKEGNHLEYALNYFKEAFNAMQQNNNLSITGRREDFGLSVDDTNSTIMHIYKTYQELGKVDDALTYFQGLLQTIRSNEVTAVNILICIGNLYDSKGNSHEAMSAFNDAVGLLESHFINDVIANEIESHDNDDMFTFISEAVENWTIETSNVTLSNYAAPAA
jgi:tetratricopeptide (TPR) repeat protein